MKQNNVLKKIVKRTYASTAALWAVLLCSAGSFIVGEYELGIAEFCLLLVLLFINHQNKKRHEVDVTEYVQRLNHHMDTATKDSLVNFPFPMVVAHLDGKVSWYNQSFAKIIDGESLFERFLSEIVEDLNWSDVLRMQNGISVDVVYHDRHYSVMGNIIKPDARRDDDYLVLLYWLDQTDLINIRKLYESEKIDIGIIMADNYDDVMQSCEDSIRPQLISQIDGYINKWAKDIDGVLKKTDRDRYIILFEHSKMDFILENKFDLLDNVRSIDVGNKTPATISIGIGSGGDGVHGNDEYSRMALDMALGRGGDQAVIKDESQFKFFGGTNREHESSTRVKSRVVAYALHRLIINTEKTVIMGHVNPDLDAIGSAIGLARAVKNCGKPVYIVCGAHNQTVENMMQEIMKDEMYHGVFISPEEAVNIVDSDTLLIVTDTHRPSITDNPALLGKAGEIVVIDHHRRSTEFVNNCSLVYHEPYASSACEMVTELLQYMDNRSELTKREAEALYAGICLDTKNFLLKTGVRTFDAAAYLRKHGVDPVAVKQLFRYDLSHYASRVDIVKGAEIVHGNIAIAVCGEHISDMGIVAAQAADELLTIDGIAASFVLAPNAEVTLISGRSLGEINVQLILEKLGGGGHLTVAGAQMRDMDVAESKEKLMAAIDEYVEYNSGKQ